MIHDNSSYDEAAFASQKVLQTIRLGACGWNYPHWQAGFYPDDLPQDWRLSYYANEFSAVLLPEKQWRTDAVEPGEWAYDVTDNFRFYLQCDEFLDPLEQSKGIEWFGEKYGGMVCVSGGQINDGVDKATGVAVINMQSKDMRGWREWLAQHAASLQAIFLRGDKLSYQQLSDFKILLELLGYADS
ncbi:MAG TPA: hypothetical protein ENJ08_09265 [Gammaproteobacteria bacterium]|nr:hypothetical protein [Gammaproteobacteria bacterium]